MSENMQDYRVTYSINKLSETARIFRRLGEAYESTADACDERNGFSRQLFLVADVLEECMTMQVRTKKLNREDERNLVVRCMHQGIRIRDARLAQNGRGKYELILQARTVGRSCVSVKKLEAAISQTAQCGYMSDDYNHMVVNHKYQEFVFIQNDRFRILTGVARKNKMNEKVCGDNFMIKKFPCGKMSAAIADGCGSGENAFLESRHVIELMENCIEASFNEKTAIDLINAAYMSGGGTKNPVTMDMSVINCQTGMLDCIKLGAAATFIKRDGWVEIIKSTTLPIGVLENVDYDCTTKKLYHSDYVVMVSDGVLDNLSGINKEEELAQIINNVNVRKPKAMAQEILEMSLKMNCMKALDDCTVLVLGVFDTYDK
ncbi:MAG: SpoIIE family protein phosphatase [Eubacteriales bacterium]|nr:SpoIIE family protein phosphatase [Eubacteriales bacterium]